MKDTTLCTTQDEFQRRRPWSTAAYARRWLGALLRGGIAVAAATLGMAGWAQAQSADMLVSSHVADINPAPIGATVTYTVTVTNNGPSSATGVSLKYVLPVFNGDTAAYVSAASSRTGDTCTPNGPPATEITCTLGAVGVGASNSVIITIQARLPSQGIWQSAATVSSATTDGNLGNNSFGLSVTAGPSADLALTATSNKGTPPAAQLKQGETYNYTLTVKNNGPDNLPADSDTTVTFEVPDGAVITARPSGLGWTCMPATGYPMVRGASPPPASITCTRANNDGLSNGASYPPITVPSAASTTGSIGGLFSVGSKFFDADHGNNTAVVDVDVGSDTYSDMDIRKTSNPPTNYNTGQSPTLAVDQEFTYTLQARLRYGANATNVVVTDTLPAEIDFVDWSPVPADWVCDYVPATHTITCTDAGPIVGPMIDLSPITFKAKANQVSASLPGGKIINTARVEADQDDPNPGDNQSSTAIIATDDGANLLVTKDAVPGAVIPGGKVTYTIRVTNQGPAPIMPGQTVTVTDVIPVGMTLLSTAQARINTGWPTWNCTVDSAPLSVPVPSNISYYPPLTNLATPIVGDGVKTITCTWTSPTATFPPGTAFPALFFGAQNNGDLGANNVLHNQACASGGAPIKPDCGESDVPITDAADSTDLEVVYKNIVDPAAPPFKGGYVIGQLLTFEIKVRNNGPVTAQDVFVRDILPDLTPGSWLAASQYNLERADYTNPAGSGSCTPAAPQNAVSSPPVTILCNVGPLAPNEEAIVTIAIRPDTTMSDVSLTNTAIVYSPDLGDTDPGNNSKSVDYKVKRSANLTVSKNVAPATAPVGTPLTYTLTVRNQGRSYASTEGTEKGVTLTDTLPPDTMFLGPVGTGVTHTASPENGQCTWPAVGAISTAATPLTITCTWDRITPQWNMSADPAAQFTATYRLTTLPEVLLDASGQPQTQATVTNKVHADTPVYQPSDKNNDGKADVTVTKADLSLVVTKTDDPYDPVDVGTNAVFTVTIKNSGPSYGTNLVVTDTFPFDTPPTQISDALFSYEGDLKVYHVVSGVDTPIDPSTYQCVQPPIGSLSGTLTCTFDRIAPRDPPSPMPPDYVDPNDIVITYKVEGRGITNGTPDGTMYSKVTIHVDEVVNDLITINEAHEHTTITLGGPPDTDLSLDKKFAKDKLMPDEPTTFTLKVTNNGPNPLTDSDGAYLTDVVPGVFTVDAGALPNECMLTGQTVRCYVGALAVGDSVTYTIAVTVNKDAQPGQVTNKATVTVHDDADPSNDTGEDTTTINGMLLTLTKTTKATELRNGQEVIYTFTVENVGDIDVLIADNAQVVDKLPPGLIYKGANTTACALMPAPAVNTVACDVGELKIGETKTFDIAVTVDGSLIKTGTLKNEATLIVDGEDKDKDDVTLPVGQPPNAAPAPIPSLNTYGLLLLLAAIAGLGGMYRRKYW